MEKEKSHLVLNQLMTMTGPQNRSQEEWIVGGVLTQFPALVHLDLSENRIEPHGTERSTWTVLDGEVSNTDSPRSLKQCNQQ
jgi:hypothetical protein